ncbi:MAG: NUDIX domain-containing protein [Candidatus Shapirobacteria bacterium]|jgi:mutator protein MutT
MDIQKFAQKGIVINDNKEILFIKYSSSKYVSEKLTGKFALPGGRIEFGETPNKSIIREVEEETGIKCKPGIPIYCWNWEYQKDSDRIQVNAVARVCKYVSGRLSQPKEEEELTIEGCYWKAKEIVLDLDVVWDEIPALKLFIDNYNFYLKCLEENRF